MRLEASKQETEKEKVRERQHGANVKSLIETSTTTSPETATSSP